MDYEILKKQTNVGWNTWNTRNVLSYSYLPEGFTINLCIKEYSNAMPLRESLVGRYAEYEEKIFPGARSYDGMGCGVGNSDKFYHWGGLLAYIALDNEGERSC